MNKSLIVVQIMKKILILFLAFILSNQSVCSQETESGKFPSDYGKYSFPLWSKITLELKEIDGDKYEYRILSFEPCEEYYSFDESKNLFSEEPLENTVEIFFVGGYYNEGKEDKDYVTLLNIRNNLKKPVTYKADIKYYFNDEFENTSIVGAFPGVDTKEIWQHKIDYIALYDFEILKYE